MRPRHSCRFCTGWMKLSLIFFENVNAFNNLQNSIKKNIIKSNTSISVSIYLVRKTHNILDIFVRPKTADKPLISVFAVFVSVIS